MKFSLIAYLIITGDVHAFKLDSGLTYEDCNAAVSRGGAKSTTIAPGLSVDLSKAPLVCEIELQPAITVAAH
jgi:hypothetical protein